MFGRDRLGGKKRSFWKRGVVGRKSAQTVSERKREREETKRRKKEKEKGGVGLLGVWVDGCRCTEWTE